MTRRFAIGLGLLAALVSGGCVTEKGDFDLWPLYRNARGADGSGEFAILWPLSNFEWSEDEEVSWTVPFHVHWETGDTEEGTLFPLIPLYVHQRAPDFEATSVFPLFDRAKRGARTDTRMLILLADWARYDGEEDLASLGVFPLFKWEDAGSGERLGLLHALELAPWRPLVSLLAIDDSKQSFGADEDTPGRSVDFVHAGAGLVNLFHWDDVGSHDDLRVLTVLGNEEWSLFQRRTPHDGATGGDTAQTIFFPFWWDVQHDAETRTRALWPFYGAKVRDDQTLARWILFPLLKTENDPDAGTSGFDVVWPVLFSWDESETGYEWTTVLKAFGYGTDGEKSWLRLLWFPIDL